MKLWLQSHGSDGSALVEAVSLWKGLVLLWRSSGGGELLSSENPVVGVILSQSPDYKEAGMFSTSPRVENVPVG